MSTNLWLYGSLYLNAFLGICAVVLSAGVPDAYELLMIGPLMGFWMRRKGVHAHSWIGVVLGVVGFFGGSMTLVQFGVQDIGRAFAESVLWLLLGRMVTADSVRHDYQVLLLSCGLILLGGVLNFDLSYGVFLALYTVLLIWTLVALHFETSNSGIEGSGANGGASAEYSENMSWTLAGYLTLISVVVFMVAGSVFVGFPRFGSPAWGFLRGKSVNMKEDVSLKQSFLDPSEDNYVLGRVYGLDEMIFSKGLYLRGSIYDRISPIGFSRSPASIFRSFGSAGRMKRKLARDEYEYEVYAQPTLSRALFVLGEPSMVQFLKYGVKGGVSRLGWKEGVFGEIESTEALIAPVKYGVRGEIFANGDVLGSLGDQVCLSNPSCPFLNHHRVISEASKNLVQPIIEEQDLEAQSPEVIVKKVIAFLNRYFVYSLESENRKSSEPLRSFLFENRTGHCEYFALSLVTILRALEIPSRIVGGYYGGSWDGEDNIVVFMGRDAHVWVEWLDEEGHWHLADPTVAGDQGLITLSGSEYLIEKMRRYWDEYILDFGIGNQVSMLEMGSDWLGDSKTYLDGAKEKIPALLMWSVVVGLMAIAFWVVVNNVGLSQEKRLRRHLESFIGRRLGRPLLPHESFLNLAQSEEMQRNLGATAQKRLIALLKDFEEISYGDDVADKESLVGWRRKFMDWSRQNRGRHSV